MGLGAKILGFLSIHPDRNQSWILFSLVISGLLLTYAHPTITKAVISALPSEWIAFESMSFALSGLVIGMLWKNRVREIAIQWFFWICIFECSVGFLFNMYLCFICYNVWLLAITSLIYNSLIVNFVAKCVMVFKSKLWNDRGREIYDNNHAIVTNIVCLLGYLMAILFAPSLQVSLFLFGICCIFDDIGWIVVYRCNRAVLLN